LVKRHFSVRRASRADAIEIGTIHVKATRFAYRGIYSDAYLDGLSPAVRAEKWIEAGRGALASDDPDVAVFVACDGAAIVGFGCAGRSEGDERAAELFALYLDPAVVGKGVGRALFAACMGHARERGFPVVG
jgi:GNAT superfamily N-acetyltransferase